MPCFGGHAGRGGGGGGGGAGGAAAAAKPPPPPPPRLAADYPWVPDPTVLPEVLPVKAPPPWLSAEAYPKGPPPHPWVADPLPLHAMVRVKAAPKPPPPKAAVAKSFPE